MEIGENRPLTAPGCVVFGLVAPDHAARELFNANGDSTTGRRDARDAKAIVSAGLCSVPPRRDLPVTWVSVGIIIARLMGSFRQGDHGIHDDGRGNVVDDVIGDLTILGTRLGAELLASTSILLMLLFQSAPARPTTVKERRPRYHGNFLRALCSHAVAG